MISVFLIIAICGFVSQCTAAEGDPIVVQFDSGTITGYANDKSWQFNGIPFAEPPVCLRRWQNPKEIEPFPGRNIDAKDPKPICPQNCEQQIDGTCSEEISEDCLYLNIFVPLSWNGNKEAKFSVLLFIYGGGFIFGSAGTKIYNSKYLSEHTNTIVVTFNYRVGALGFMRNKQIGIPGNMGFMDQRMAMKWVNKYISNFGGDKDKITLFGQSAGAISVAAHMVSKGSQDLFQHAIIQSNPWTIPLHNPYEAQMTGFTFSMLLLNKCWFIQCSWKQIIEVQNEFKLANTWPADLLEAAMVWGPFIDGKELTDQPFNLIPQLYTTNQNKPVIIGTTTDEGYIFVEKMFNCVFPFCGGIYDTLMYLMFGSKSGKVIEKYKDQSNNYKERMAMIFGDYVFYCPTRFLTDKIANPNTAVYNYLWDVGSVVNGPCSGRKCHGAELLFLFNTAQLMGITFNENQNKVSSLIQTYWGNMAKYGTTNSNTEAETLWDKYDQDRAQMQFKTPDSGQIEDYRREFCDFFDEIGYTRPGIFNFKHHLDHSFDSSESYLDEDELLSNENDLHCDKDDLHCDKDVFTAMKNEV